MLRKTNYPMTFIRYGIARKKEFLRDVKNSYDGLVLPANILLYQYRSTPSVVFMCKKPFFIDPMSYLFGQPYEKFKKRVKKGAPEFKPSFYRLMKGHGMNPEEYLNIGYTELLRKLNKSENDIRSFVDNCFNFQWNNVWDVVQQSTDLLTEEEMLSLKEEDYRPVFLVPPYFLYGYEPDSVTTALNEKILNYCWQEKSGQYRVYPMVFIDKQQLISPSIHRIINIVRKYHFPGYVLWIEDFDERFVSKEQVINLIKLVNQLSEDNAQIVMLFGGFFSTVLTYYGLSCVCHGIAYGESRSILASTQERSGPAPIRYYMRDFHTFLPIESALIVLRQLPELMCNCPICQRVLRGNPENVTLFSDEEALAEMHFLYNRYQERKLIANHKIEDIIEHLDWVISLYEDITDITKPYKTTYGYQNRSIIDPDYIRIWKSAYEETKELVK